MHMLITRMARADNANGEVSPFRRPGHLSLSRQLAAIGNGEAALAAPGSSVLRMRAAFAPWPNLRLGAHRLGLPLPGRDALINAYLVITQVKKGGFMQQLLGSRGPGQVTARCQAQNAEFCHDSKKHWHWTNMQILNRVRNKPNNDWECTSSALGLS